MQILPEAKLKISNSFVAKYFNFDKNKVESKHSFAIDSNVEIIGQEIRMTKLDFFPLNPSLELYSANK